MRKFIEQDIQNMMEKDPSGFFGFPCTLDGQRWYPPASEIDGLLHLDVKKKGAIRSLDDLRVRLSHRGEPRPP